MVYTRKKRNRKLRKSLKYKGGAWTGNDQKFIDAITELQLGADEKTVTGTLSNFVTSDKSIVNAKDPDTGETPLHVACKQNKINVVKYLISRGANHHIDKYGRLPLYYACEIDSTDIVMYLLDLLRRGNLEFEEKDLIPPFHMSVKMDNLELIKEFLRVKKDFLMNSKYLTLEPLQSALNGTRNVKVPTYFIDELGVKLDGYERGNTPIQYTFESNNVQIAMKLIEKIGATVEHLRLAIYNHSPEIVTFLMSKGISAKSKLKLPKLGSTLANVKISDPILYVSIPNPKKKPISFKTKYRIVTTLYRNGAIIPSLLEPDTQLIINYIRAEDIIGERVLSLQLLSLLKILREIIDNTDISSNGMKQIFEFVVFISTSEPSIEIMQKKKSELFNKLKEEEDENIKSIVESLETHI